MDSSNEFAGGFIIVDWGTTSLRAVLVDVSGEIHGRVETARGIQSIVGGRFEEELLTSVGDWLREHGALTIIAFGMITSRNGWEEVPYVSCPASVGDLASAAVRRELSNGSALFFLPGITDETRRPFPDVMRGEETQLVGYGLQKDATIVLPGTHSKWARILSGRIDGFQTFVTGEIYALLSQHSFIARVAADVPTTAGWSAFDRGVDTAKSCDPGKNPLLTLLFSARTGMLADQLEPGEICDYVSGLLIGNEFCGAQDCGWFKRDDTIGIVGNDGLNTRYKRAALAFGLLVDDGGEDAAVLGALIIARDIKGR